LQQLPLWPRTTRGTLAPGTKRDGIWWTNPRHPDTSDPMHTHWLAQRRVLRKGMQTLTPGIQKRTDAPILLTRSCGSDMETTQGSVKQQATLATIKQQTRTRLLLSFCRLQKTGKTQRTFFKFMKPSRALGYNETREDQGTNCPCCSTFSTDRKKHSYFLNVDLTSFSMEVSAVTSLPYPCGDTVAIPPRPSKMETVSAMG
jgi:hypothetical protein